MSSRQEEKRRRREEREAREKADRAAAARRKRLQLALGGLLGMAAVAAVVLVVVIGLGGGDTGSASEPGEPAADVQLPEQRIGDLDEAAEAANCRVTHPELEGATHETRDFRASDYQTNPPTSGNHFPQWAEDGVYEPGSTPQLGQLVHTLEHGRINVQYKPGTPERTVDQLEALLKEQSDGYHMLLYENPTGMDGQVAATTWGHSVTCPQMNDRVFDVLRTFRASYIDQGPEDVP